MNDNLDDHFGKLTELDALKLQDLEPDDEMILESGRYKVCHYGKTLVILGMTKRAEFKEFKNKELALSWLAKN